MLLAGGTCDGLFAGVKRGVLAGLLDVVGDDAANGRADLLDVFCWCRRK
jgi:hypothetical protein